MVFFLILGIQARYDGEWWGGSDDQELEDEKRDAEILKAVQTSVAEWEARKNSRSRYYIKFINLKISFRKFAILYTLKNIKNVNIFKTRCNI